MISAVVAFVLSVSAIGCLITGYGLPVDSLWNIYLWCGIFALASAVIFYFRYGGRIIVCSAVLMLFVLWKTEAAWQQTQFLGFIISSHYHRVYNWPVIGTPAANAVFLPLILWAVLVTVCVNWYICRRKHIIYALFPSVTPMVLCFLTTDRVPDTAYLYLLILGLIILLVTDWTMRKNPAQGMKLILWSVIPIAVFLGLIFYYNPRDTYINHADKFQKEVVVWFQELQDTTDSMVNGISGDSSGIEKLNLRAVGPKSQISYSVMRVNASIGGTLYLRGRDYDHYTGTGWEASSDRDEKFSSGAAPAGKVTIVTYGVRSVLYVPYYAVTNINLVGGAYVNDGNDQQYSYYLSRTGSGKSGAPSLRYTQLPEDTLQWAKELVDKITGGSVSDKETILRIQNYVRDSAVYDLSTSRMDSQYSDFAQWFLENSETGYCVHFATAATVLLRAAGIPARYVEGYMVNCREGSDVIVSNQEAHAWVEYFDSESGDWRVLEATPADLEEERTDPTDTVPVVTTSPEDTQTEAENTRGENVPTEPHPGWEETPSGSDEPSGKTVGQHTGKKAFTLPDWLKHAFNCILLLSFIPIQGYIRIYRKRTLWNRGKPNERTMSRWRQTRSLAKLLKQPYPEDLDNLAQKAKFSQHRIQPDELQQFEDFRVSLIVSVFNKPWYYRIVFKWILAIDLST